MENCNRDKSDDETLINIHVNNPLHKIVELLQDIKKQKALTFTLKGSVGIVGIAVVLVGGGVFGGNKLLCNKGMQAHVGEVRVLSYNKSVALHPVKDKIWSILGIPTNTQVEPVKWAILIGPQYNAVRLVGGAGGQAYLEAFAGRFVLAVGYYNSCTQELKVTNERVVIY